MDKENLDSELSNKVEHFIREKFASFQSEAPDRVESNQKWQKVRECGTELWLDTGDRDEANDLWTNEFEALTTNNSLLNSVVQTGEYDDVIRDANELLTEFNLDESTRILEIAFILNALHGLRLVDQFDALVSVEQHTELAHDLEYTIYYADRYHSICPDNFVVKIPFTPAGLIATARLSDQGVPVNLTVGFSARQNYLATRLARPHFVNVFMGRINSFIASNDLGAGEHAGQKALLSSQGTVEDLRSEQTDLQTRQIAASFRDAGQISDTCGVDVMTLPPSVAEEYLETTPEDETLSPQSHDSLTVRLESDGINVEDFWNLGTDFKNVVDQILNVEVNNLTPERLRGSFRESGLQGFLPDWSERQVLKSYEEGKIPKLENWRQELEQEQIAVDSLMNLAGLNAFHSAQVEMDNRIRSLLGTKRDDRSLNR